MADAQPNSGGLAVDPPGMAKKKKAKAPRKPRSECTPEEIAKLNAESTKRRNRRAVVKENAATAKFAVERAATVQGRGRGERGHHCKAHALLMLDICRPADFSAAAVGPASTGSSVAGLRTASRRRRGPRLCRPTSPAKARRPDPFLRVVGRERDRAVHCAPVGHHRPQRHTWVQQRWPAGRQDAKKASTTAVYGHHAIPRVLFDGMPTPMPPVDDPYNNQFIEDVIYDGGHVPAYDLEETQSQDGRAQFVADEEVDDRADYDHGDSWHEDDDIYVEEAFKARHNDKSFTLTHCWMIINNFPKFKDQYRELQRKRGKKTAKFAGGGDGEALKRPRGTTNSKDVRDEKKRQSKDEQMKQYLELQRKKLEMEEAAKRWKIDMEEAARQMQLDIEAANVKARQGQMDIEATNAATKAKGVALAIMGVD
ncbi:hypothetical protein VPH35_131145 [Triticum aestivum]